MPLIGKSLGHYEITAIDQQRIVRAEPTDAEGRQIVADDVERPVKFCFEDALPAVGQGTRCITVRGERKIFKNPGQGASESLGYRIEVVEPR